MSIELLDVAGAGVVAGAVVLAVESGAEDVEAELDALGLLAAADEGWLLALDCADGWLAEALLVSPAAELEGLGAAEVEAALLLADWSGAVELEALGAADVEGALLLADWSGAVELEALLLGAADVEAALLPDADWSGAVELEALLLGAADCDVELDVLLGQVAETIFTVSTL